jgi:hypothetical protein
MRGLVVAYMASDAQSGMTRDSSSQMQRFCGCSKPLEGVWMTAAPGKGKSGGIYLRPCLGLCEAGAVILMQLS